MKKIAFIILLLFIVITSCFLYVKNNENRNLQIKIDKLNNKLNKLENDKELYDNKKIKINKIKEENKSKIDKYNEVDSWNQEVIKYLK